VNASIPPASTALPQLDLMMNYVSFLSNVCGALKQLKRTGWIRHRVPLPESDCDHMHRCAMCAMLVMSHLQQQVPPEEQEQQGQQETTTTTTLTTAPLDGIKLLKMALTHDVCEALAGDITPHCEAHLLQSKHEREREAMQQIRQLLDGHNEDDAAAATNHHMHHQHHHHVTNVKLGEELYQLWQEYEEQSTIEAIYCKDIDKFEMVLQAYEYEKQHLRCKQNGLVVEQDVEGGGEQVTEDGEATATTTNIKATYFLTQPVQHHPLRDFFISTNAAMKTSFFQQLDWQVRRQREDMLRERGWEVTDAERQQTTMTEATFTQQPPSEE
jgi:putative hydrolase of HD superfamily